MREGRLVEPLWWFREGCSGYGAAYKCGCGGRPSDLVPRRGRGHRGGSRLGRLGVRRSAAASEPTPDGRGRGAGAVAIGGGLPARLRGYGHGRACEAGPRHHVAGRLRQRHGLAGGDAMPHRPATGSGQLPTAGRGGLPAVGRGGSAGAAGGGAGRRRGRRPTVVWIGVWIGGAWLPGLPNKQAPQALRGFKFGWWAWQASNPRPAD